MSINRDSTVIGGFKPDLGRVVQNPVNPNPGLKVNLSMYISCIETFFTAYALCSSRLFKSKIEGQKI